MFLEIKVKKVVNKWKTGLREIYYNFFFGIPIFAIVSFFSVGAFFICQAVAVGGELDSIVLQTYLFRVLSGLFACFSWFCVLPAVIYIMKRKDKI